ncbi:MAG TPA: choice-of-anchor J domain-containing protein [Ignavibacteria bacterium]|nr:choice-of-anchor J domain-containing protein [Ignavibacteria bacterium]
MKKLFILVLFLMVISVSSTFAQRVILNETFETAGFNTDSLPTGWLKFNEDGGDPNYPFCVWSVRDSGTVFPGVNAILNSQAYQSLRSMSIAWRAGAPIANDWVYTDSMTIQAGDSLMFWALFGQPVGISFGNLIDTFQVYFSQLNAPGAADVHIATLRSNDSDNVWTQFKFSLNQFAGQTGYVAFRYWMNTSVDGLRVNIDNVWVGNRAAVNISQIGSNVPTSFALNQNYPNPFNPKTKIRFDVAKATNVKLVVFNSLGQVVKELVDGMKSAGTYEAEFDASSLASGTYFYRLITDDFTETKKMLLVK